MKLPFALCGVKRVPRTSNSWRRRYRAVLWGIGFRWLSLWTVEEMKSYCGGQGAERSCGGNQSSFSRVHGVFKSQLSMFGAKQFQLWKVNSME